MNLEGSKETISISFDFFKSKKVQNILLVVLLLLTIFVGAYIRVQSLPNLKDSTTGDYTPLALDPYYFLRVSETLIANDGNLPETDIMRYPALNAPWTSELIPHSTVLIYKIIKIFNPDASVRFANVINPVIFFILGLIAFFFLVYVLTKSKWIALVSSAILTVIPPYLYRTLAGFSDHESIGMFGFFLAILFFSMGMLYLEKRKVTSIKSILIGLISGLATAFSIVSWGGGAKFLFMILPLAFIIIWLTKKEKNKLNYIYLYTTWIIGTLIGALIFGQEISSILKSYMIASTSILTFFNLGYIFLDFISSKYKLLEKRFFKHKKLIIAAVTITIGAIFYQIFAGDFFSLSKVILDRIISPFGTARIAVTVAENKQPYLVDWINQIGTFIFYAFLLGCLIVGKKISNGIKEKKLRPLFTFSFAFLIFGILYSRISSASFLNGENFWSSALILLSFLVFAVSSIYIYIKSEWEIDSRWVLIAVWMIPMLLAVRSAIRVFFAIVPFVSFMVPLALFEVGKFARRNKDDLIRLVSYLVFGVLIV